MVKKHLGDTIDIHGGGSDLTFPHHENEAAQSRCANDNPGYVRYWLHNGMLNLGTEKVSVCRQCIDYSQLAGEAQQRGAALHCSRDSTVRPTWSDDLLARQATDSLYQGLRDV